MENNEPVKKTADRKAYYKAYYRKNKEKLYQKNREYYLAYWKKNYKPKKKTESVLKKLNNFSMKNETEDK